MSEYLTIQRMFKANKFEIPSYQRAYSWETPQLKQFVADLLEAREKYYMGHFLFENSGDPLLVIDGQQRITTCMIFFRAVVNVLNKKNAVDFDRQIKICRSYLYDANEELPGLKTVSYDNAYFQDLIIENSEQTSATTKSQQNIKSAKSFFEKELNKLSGEDIVRIVTLLPSYPKTRMQAKFPFLRRKETISAGNFIGRDHLQTVDLSPIVPSSILNSGIQTRGILRRKAG